MNNSGEIGLQDLIPEAIKLIKDANSDKVNEEQKQEETKDTTLHTENSLLKLKKEFAEKYVREKIINNTDTKGALLNSSGLVEDYLISEDFGDKIKDMFLGGIVKNGLDQTTIQNLDETKKKLETISTLDELRSLENEIFKPQTATIQNQPTPESQIPQTTPETQQETTPLNLKLLAKNLPADRQETFLKYAPTIINEADKYPQTKGKYKEIFAQITKESGRKTKAHADKGEDSIGLMQINRAAGHPQKLTTSAVPFDIETPEGNIGYGIAYLAQCIQKEENNFARGLDRYNGTANFKKPTEKKYSTAVLNKTHLFETAA